MTGENGVRGPIGSGTANVVVVGQGYVGLTLATAAAEAGFAVTGYDVDATRAHQLAMGELVVAGVDDRTAASSRLPGHRADHAAALAGADPDLPVLLLAHQPRQIAAAVEHGIDLQLSGHTHGGQIWPFHYLVRLDQPAVQGLTRHGGRTQLYTSRGTGFWGPPFRVFAPSEITLLTLRAA